jgi:hypothetical protein
MKSESRWFHYTYVAINTYLEPDCPVQTFLSYLEGQFEYLSLIYA